MYTVTDIFLFISLILSIVYAAYLGRWTVAWTRKDQKVGKNSNGNWNGISVVIPFRNEEQNVLKCVESLKTQVLGEAEVEFIFIDDHSEDASVEMLQEVVKNDPRFRLIKSDGKGKKDALRTGIYASKFDFIGTLDVDCLVGENWLTQIKEELKNVSCDFLILPVLVERPNSFFGDVAFTEWCSLAGITGGAAMSGDALMCNGGNLVFRKKLYELYDIPNEHSVSSGDDMFLMIQAKKVGVVSYGKEVALIARTTLPGNLVGFINQRVRWAGKSKKMNDPSILRFGLFLLSFEMMLIALAVTNVFNGGNWFYFTAILTTKIAFEFRLMNAMSRVFNIPWSFTSLVVLSLLHPFYTIFVALLSLVYKPDWKGRKIRV